MRGRNTSAAMLACICLVGCEPTTEDCFAALSSSEFVTALEVSKEKIEDVEEICSVEPFQSIDDARIRNLTIDNCYKVCSDELVIFHSRMRSMHSLEERLCDTLQSDDFSGMQISFDIYLRNWRILFEAIEGLEACIEKMSEQA